MHFSKNLNLSQANEKFSQKDIFEKVINEYKSLDIERKLRAFTVAANHISGQNVNSKYHLISLDIENRRVIVKNYSEAKLEEANKEYTEIERQISEGAKLQVVLVSAGSINSLRQAYPNYFLDTGEFLKKIDYLEKQLKK